MISWLALASSVTDVLKDGEAIGTASNQQILGALILALILFLIYREKQQGMREKQNLKHHQELVAKIDMERASMTDERVKRINHLMGIIEENTSAFVGLKTFLESAVRIERK